MKIRITRRQAAIILTAALGGGSAAVWWLRRHDPAPVAIDLPPPPEGAAPSFEIFLALSRLLLARQSLDETVARQIYDVVMREPEGPKHLGATYADFHALLTTGQGRANESDLQKLGSGERWFVSHLVTTWFLGIYYHEQRPTRRIAYEGALMFEALRGLRPVPFVESIGFGAWSDPPAVARRERTP